MCFWNIIAILYHWIFYCMYSQENSISHKRDKLKKSSLFVIAIQKLYKHTKDCFLKIMIQKCMVLIYEWSWKYIVNLNQY